MTDEEVPFTESELRAARIQMQMRDFGTAMTRFAAWEEAVRQEMAQLAEQRRLAAVAAAKRQKRVDAAELYLRRQGCPSEQVDA